MQLITPNEPDKPLLSVCGGELNLNVTVEPPEADFEDNVRIELCEDGPPERKLLTADAVAFNLTSAGARKLAQALLAAAKQNDQWLKLKKKRQ